MRKSSVVLVALALQACTPNNEQLQLDARQAQVAAQNQAADAEFRKCVARYPTEQRSRQNAVPYARCMIAAYNGRATKNDLVLAINYKRLELAEKLASGRITLAEYRSQYAAFGVDMKSQALQRQNQAQMVAATQRSAQAAECAVAQQRVANTSYSGLDSTSGVVAVASLLGALADGASVANACK
jgi:hypothetical protein